MNLLKDQFRTKFVQLVFFKMRVNKLKTGELLLSQGEQTSLAVFWFSGVSRSTPEHFRQQNSREQHGGRSVGTETDGKRS